MKEILLKYMTEFTSLSEEEQRAIFDALQVEEYKKGTFLLQQGDLPVIKCYFVLKGCVRQFFVDEFGKEVTTNFFTEEQAIPIFNDQRRDEFSKYSYACLEDSTLVVGEPDSEQVMYKTYSQLETMTRKMMEINLSEVQDEFAEFIKSSPEERYKSIVKKCPQLVHRVPQHQLASFLGITPESLSRIKKRIEKEK
ncbi:Crp/Fnr family transcriptional regulator [Fredinandcohnia humi]